MIKLICEHAVYLDSVISVCDFELFFILLQSRKLVFDFSWWHQNRNLDLDFFLMPLHELYTLLSSEYNFMLCLCDRRSETIKYDKSVNIKHYDPGKQKLL